MSFAREGGETSEIRDLFESIFRRRDDLSVKQKLVQNFLNRSAYSPSDLPIDIVSKLFSFAPLKTNRSYMMVSSPFDTNNKAVSNTASNKNRLAKLSKITTRSESPLTRLRKEVDLKPKYRIQSKENILSRVNSFVSRSSLNEYSESSSDSDDELEPPLLLPNIIQGRRLLLKERQNAKRGPKKRSQKSTPLSSTKGPDKMSGRSRAAVPVIKTVRRPSQVFNSTLAFSGKTVDRGIKIKRKRQIKSLKSAKVSKNLKSSQKKPTRTEDLKSLGLLSETRSRPLHSFRVIIGVGEHDQSKSDTVATFVSSHSMSSVAMPPESPAGRSSRGTFMSSSRGRKIKS